MHVALDSLDVPVGDDVLDAVDKEMAERASSPMFRGVRDVRLRLRRAKGALLCIVAVGFTAGDLVTSTATSESPLEAIVGALDGLPDRIERAHRTEERRDAPGTGHGAVRDELKRLLARA